MTAYSGPAADLTYPGDNGYGEGQGCPTCPCCHVDTCADFGCHMAERTGDGR
jgi:hypothetical protein